MTDRAVDVAVARLNDLRGWPWGRILGNRDAMAIGVVCDALAEARRSAEGWRADALNYARSHGCQQQMTEKAERELAEARQEIAHLKALIKHCDHCGGDYMETGLETGCACRAAAAQRERDAQIVEKATTWLVPFDPQTIAAAIRAARTPQEPIGVED